MSDLIKDTIKYRAGYKYQLAVDYKILIKVYPKENIKTPFIELTRDGLLTIKAGYAWDGASGPTFDTKNSMRGALVHDVLYQLMRMQLLEQSWRLKSDEILYEILVEDGMFRLRAWAWKKCVNQFASGASKHENDNPLQIAP